MYDFRSDTVTQPTEAMREAMANAIVGDDVYEDDPTVKELEELAAKMLKKEAALFVPSGTFGNQLALLTHTKRGDEVILGEDNHILAHEVGAASVIAGVQLRPVVTINGLMEPNEVLKRIREEDIHYPDTGLICMENAHGSGMVIPLDNMKAIYDIAFEKGIPVHLDGARLFNGAEYLGCLASDIAQYADSIMFCLSKGLCSPFGSMLVGKRDFIEKARKNRKLMGGGMRQAGHMAACGIISLKEMLPRLNEDHRLARIMAEKLDAIEGIEVLWERQHINMVFFTMNQGLIAEDDLIEKLYALGFKVNGTEDGEWRFVTNNDVDEAAVLSLCDAVKKLINE